MKRRVEAVLGVGLVLIVLGVAVAVGYGIASRELGLEGPGSAGDAARLPSCRAAVASAYDIIEAYETIIRALAADDMATAQDTWSAIHEEYNAEDLGVAIDVCLATE
jgi:hypothetical protein